jgi:phosphoglycolate phosphatase-like HAD superfamily hydrolase
MTYKTVVFDLDGVLAEFSGKWEGCGKIGEPIRESISMVQKLHRDGNVLILCSTRLNPEEENVDIEVSERAVINWLAKHGILDCFDKITGYKPLGDIYIDDRCLRFDNKDGFWEKFMEYLYK